MYLRRMDLHRLSVPASLHVKTKDILIFLQWDSSVSLWAKKSLHGREKRARNIPCEPRETREVDIFVFRTKYHAEKDGVGNALSVPSHGEAFPVILSVC